LIERERERLKRDITSECVSRERKKNLDPVGFPFQFGFHRFRWVLLLPFFSFLFCLALCLCSAAHSPSAGSLIGLPLPPVLSSPPHPVVEGSSSRCVCPLALQTRDALTLSHQRAQASYGGPMMETHHPVGYHQHWQTSQILFLLILYALLLCCLVMRGPVSLAYYSML